MRPLVLTLIAFTTGCLNGPDFSQTCSPADRGDPTSRCYCFSAADRDRIRPYDDNAPPAYGLDDAHPQGGERSLYDGSTVQPSGGGSSGRGPTVIPR